MRKLALYFSVLFNLIYLISFAYADSNEGTAPAFILKWGTSGSGNGQFRPRGICSDPQGNIYVVDSSNNRIQKFTQDGTFITKWGAYGSGDGQFNVPVGICSDLQGYIYVIESGNDRIQKFTRDGTFITKWGTFGSGNGQFYYPKTICSDSQGYIYVADTYNYRIQKFTQDGTFITKWGSRGTNDGQFNVPIGICSDLQGYIYVADAYNGRIQKFTQDGIFITKWGTIGLGDGQFHAPFGICSDPQGYIYVTEVQDIIYYRIQKFTQDGTFITKWGTPGVDDGQFNFPMGICSDQQGNIYVADTYNYRIQKFGLATPPNVNQAPVLETIGNQSVDENVALTFTLSATDADGDTLTYSATDLPSGATLNSSTGAFSWTPDYSQAGSYSLTFSVNDGNGGTASETIIITVNNVEVLEMLDGSEFSAGREIYSDTLKLIVERTAMDGAVTDGCTRLLLRMEVNDFNQVTLSIEGESNDLENDNGFLQSIGKQNDPQKNQTLIIDPVEIGEKKYVFAVYRSPENFVRKGIDKNQDNIDDDTIISERTITLKAKSNSQTLAIRNIKLVRPPVLLIHGLWSDASMWNNFKQMLKAQVSDVTLFANNYPNDVSFDENKNVVEQQFIKHAKNTMRSKKIAMIQADIVGHSMGGLLARIYAEGEEYYSKGWYLNDKNFQEGSINKLITLDSPHYGSFLADLAIAYIHHDNLSRWQVVKRPVVKLRAWMKDHDLNSDAILDLTTTSEPIARLNAAITAIPCHAIIGDYPVVDLSLLPSIYQGLYTILESAKADLDPSPYIIQNKSDLVVSFNSQSGGLTMPNKISPFGHHHTDATTSEVAADVVKLLNESVDSVYFDTGFPVLTDVVKLLNESEE